MKKGLKIIIVIVVAIILISTAFLVLYHPPAHAFTDTAETIAPEELDPATAFFTSNGPIFSAVYQTLVEYNGSSTQLVPVLASHYTNVNDTNYTFYMRSGARFSNNQTLNATSAWFSFARGIVMGQGPYASDYPGTLFNGTMACITGIYLPVNVAAALNDTGAYHIPMATYNVSGVFVTTYNYTIAANDLANMLSHFNYNATEMKVMEYKNQALVVNMTDNSFTINSEHKYAYLLSDIAGWWGDIVEPSYVDSHGGVQADTANSYLDANGAIGSGPYVISSVGKGFSTIVIKANPNYWVTNAMVSNGSIPAIATPASIKTVVIDYGLDHADRLEDFDRGISEISTVSPASFKSMITGFHTASARNSSLVHSYQMIGDCDISMNTQENYTDNIHFREALYDALNYSAELGIYKNNYNGTSEAYLELGPLSPVYGHAFYNPDNLPLPAQSIPGAIQNISKAGNETGFYVKIGSTEYGDKSGIDLSKHTFTLTGISPLNSIETNELTIAIDSFRLIGLTFNTAAVTPSTVDGWTTANATPQFIIGIGWDPDYLDPIGQELIPVYDGADGGAFGGNAAWVDNNTLQGYFADLDYKNTTTQVEDMKNISEIVYKQYAYLWIAMPYDSFFVSPDVHGFEFNSVTSSYFYNLMTVTGKLTSSVGYMTLYTLIANIEMALTNAVIKF
jgi:ABC-type transport system substrate-binding protein